jgi:hypothetical protein
MWWWWLWLGLDRGKCVHVDKRKHSAWLWQQWCLQTQLWGLGRGSRAF